MDGQFPPRRRSSSLVAWTHTDVELLREWPNKKTHHISTIINSILTTFSMALWFMIDITIILLKLLNWGQEKNTYCQSLPQWWMNQWKNNKSPFNKLWFSVPQLWLNCVKGGIRSTLEIIQQSQPQSQVSFHMSSIQNPKCHPVIPSGNLT